MRTTAREKKAALRETADKRLLARLRQDHGIQGSSVVGNPEKDGAYREESARLQQAARKMIDRIG